VLRGVRDLFVRRRYRDILVGQSRLGKRASDSNVAVRFVYLNARASGADHAAALAYAAEVFPGVGRDALVKALRRAGESPFGGGAQRSRRR
jgi:hypothetical protein